MIQIEQRHREWAAKKITWSGPICTRARELILAGRYDEHPFVQDAYYALLVRP